MRKSMVMSFKNVFYFLPHDQNSLREALSDIFKAQTNSLLSSSVSSLPSLPYCTVRVLGSRYTKILVARINSLGHALRANLTIFGGTGASDRGS
jgi:hypothetical protein